MSKKNRILILFTVTFTIVICSFGIIRLFFATPETEKFIKRLLFNKDYKIVYFGDSVLNADHLDTNKPSSLVNIFEKNINIKTLEISGAAYNPYLYDKYLKVINKYNKNIKLVIIPINLRAFSSSWRSVPEYQFDQECSFLSIVELKINIKCTEGHIKNLLNSNRLKTKQDIFLNDKVRAQGFLNTTKNSFFDNVDNNCKIIYKKKNNSEKFKQSLNCKEKIYFDQVYEYLQHGYGINHSIMAMRFNYHYAENIKPNNASLNDLRDIISQIKKYKIKVLFYITPIDLQSIIKFSGEEVIKIISKNLTVIDKILNEENIYKLNLIGLLNTEFFNKKCACEHIDINGKKIISKKIESFINTKIGNI